MAPTLFRVFKTHLLITPAVIITFFVVCSCENDEISSTPRWQSNPSNKELSKEESRKTPFTTSTATKSTAEKTKTQRNTGEPTFCFVSYNIRNYLPTSRRVGSEYITTKKPEKEIQQLMNILKPLPIDAVGISEIGKLEDLKDFQQKLKQSGIDLPYYHHSDGSDQIRHLAILSKHPIIKTYQPETAYRLDEKNWTINRGINDALIDSPVGEIRIMGLHLKSKRKVPGRDQAQIRHQEAIVARKHIDTVLASDPDLLLIVHGDINDDYRTPPVKTIHGPWGKEGFMEPLYIRDSRDHLWTHFWSYQQEYSRLDYIFVNKNLKKLWVSEQSRIIDTEGNTEASDHRPVMATFSLIKK